MVMQGREPGDAAVRQAEYAEEPNKDGATGGTYARELVKNYIGGKWVEGSAGKTFESRNPATGEAARRADRIRRERRQQGRRGRREGVQELAAGARAAPRRNPVQGRANAGGAQGRPGPPDDPGDGQGAGRGTRRRAGSHRHDLLHGGRGPPAVRRTVPSELPNKFAMAVRDPIGVVGAITPWNFPIAIPSWKLMPALIAGNTVVFKPASDTPLLRLEFVKLLEEAGLPTGVVNVVLGPGGSVGEAMIDHPDVKLISFTGSTAAGTQVVDGGARRRCKRVSLEMGGKNAIIVLDDANLDLAVEGILWSAFGTTGQRCTAACRVIVQRGALRGATGAAGGARQEVRAGQRPGRRHRYRPRGQQAPAADGSTR